MRLSLRGTGAGSGWGYFGLRRRRRHRRTFSRGGCPHPFLPRGDTLCVEIVQRGIQQHSVFTVQPAVGPARINQKIQVRFAYRVLASDVDIVGTTIIGHDFEMQMAEDERPVYTGAFKSLRVSQSHLQAGDFIRRRRQQSDPGIERLIQVGSEFNVAQPQGKRHARDS